MIEVGLAIASVAYGALLGVFLLGVLTKRANERGATIGMLCGFVIDLYLWLGHKNSLDLVRADRVQSSHLRELDTPTRSSLTA